MPYNELTTNIYDCQVCDTKCDGYTVKQFDFEHDVAFSEEIENRVISEINGRYEYLIAKKTSQDGFPDIEIAIKQVPNKCIALIEIKGQARTFMALRRLLPQSGLYPSETIALNLSDLERYFDVSDRTSLPLDIVWCLMRRPCITGHDPNDQQFYHQTIEVLRNIRISDKTDTRRFRRKSGQGDVVNGQHKGVVVNYHFSINELMPGLPDLTKVNNSVRKIIDSLSF